MKARSIILHRHWVTAVSAFCLLAAVWLVQAQNEAKSVDLTEPLNNLLGTMNAAQTSEQAAHTRAVELIKTAEAAANRSRDTKLPAQSRFEARTNIIALKIQAARIQLEAASQNAKLLAAARDALRKISSELGTDAPGQLGPWSSQDNQASVDASIGNLNYTVEPRIYPEIAKALAAARSYYDLASKGTGQGSKGASVLKNVMRRLAAWEARNRQAIVFIEAALRQLQLAEVNEMPPPPHYPAYDPSILLSPRDGFASTEAASLRSPSSIPYSTPTPVSVGAAPLPGQLPPQHEALTAPIVYYQTPYSPANGGGPTPVYSYGGPPGVVYPGSSGSTRVVIQYRYSQPQSLTQYRPAPRYIPVYGPYHYGPFAQPPPAVSIRQYYRR